MVRPRKCRMIDKEFPNNFFKPQGVPLTELEEVILTFDEIEAIRLTDYKNLYQAEAAEKMNISRQTLGNIVKQAHKKIADAIINGKAIKIDGGKAKFQTSDYQKAIEPTDVASPKKECPKRSLKKKNCWRKKS